MELYGRGRLDDLSFSTTERGVVFESLHLDDPESCDQEMAHDGMSPIDIITREKPLGAVQAMDVA